jgi:hypothetical protein
VSFKSQAQKRKFQELVKQGKMSPEVYEEWQLKTPEKIPEKVTPKVKKKNPYPGWKMPKWGK